MRWTYSVPNPTSSKWSLVLSIKRIPWGALLETLNISSEEVIAIGDGVCDVSMIQSAGLGIAMGNAQDSVKVCADRITTSNDEDGVAMAVEKAILSEIRPAEVPLDELNQRLAMP